ncbi:MAG TPA: HTTM domain-containing protein [Gemmataceae bacterium]|jgi:hypothetical protein
MKTTTAHDAHPGPGGADASGEHPLMTPVRGWDRFFFHPIDPTSLGLVRICTGIIVLYVHFVYSLGLMNYIGPDAWIVNTGLTTAEKNPRPGEDGVTNFLRNGNAWQAPSWTWDDNKGELVTGQTLWSIYFHVEDPAWLWTIHIAIGIVLFLFTIGLWTRVMSVLAWIGAMMYIQRVPGMLFGMDTMTNLALFYLMIGGIGGATGAALSVDRWLKVRAERLRLGPAYVPQPPEPMLFANLATRLIQINFCLIYFASGTSKLLGSSWWNGTAPNRFLLNYSFAPFDVSAYTSILKFLAEHRTLWELAGAGGVIYTLFLEIGFPFLVWNRRMRWVMVSGSILLHTMIALLMGLVTFSLMMLALVLAFVPPEAVRQGLQRIGARIRLLFSPAAREAAKHQSSLALTR